MRRFLSVILIVIVAFNMATVAMAEEQLTFEINGQLRTFSEIAEKANYDEGALYEYYLKEPDQFIEQAEALYQPQRQSRSAGDTSGTDVTSLSALIALGRKGDFLISATNSTNVILGINYRHGHAAMKYDNENIIHAIGPGVKSKITTLSGFGATEKVRIYTVETATATKASNAADYAETYLVDKDYDIYAPLDSTSSLNCATLIYHAYKNQGIYLKTYFGTVTPASLVEDTNTHALGNLNWSGDEDSFEI